MYVITPPPFPFLSSLLIVFPLIDSDPLLALLSSLVSVIVNILHLCTSGIVSDHLLRSPLEFHVPSHRLFFLERVLLTVVVLTSLVVEDLVKVAVGEAMGLIDLLASVLMVLVAIAGLDLVEDLVEVTEGEARNLVGLLTSVFMVLVVVAGLDLGDDLVTVAVGEAKGLVGLLARVLMVLVVGAGLDLVFPTMIVVLEEVFEEGGVVLLAVTASLVSTFELTEIGTSRLSAVVIAAAEALVVLVPFNGDLEAAVLVKVLVKVLGATVVVELATLRGGKWAGSRALVDAVVGAFTTLSAGSVDAVVSTFAALLAGSVGAALSTFVVWLARFDSWLSPLLASGLRVTIFPLLI